MDAAEQKRAAAERAAELVEDGMRLGLGTGSTAALFVEALGRRVALGLSVVAVPTSEASARQAKALGIRLVSLEEQSELDLTVDGADEIDPFLNLTKGGGGALLREKLVASASRRMVVIADASKRVERLGRFPLPIEIVPFGYETTRRRVVQVLERLAPGGTLVLRSDAGGRPFLTDGGHYILDARLGSIASPADVAHALKNVLGVVEHGLFIGLASAALIGAQETVMEIAPRTNPSLGARATCG